MKRPKIGRIRWLIGFALLPPALWALVLSLVPTEWAKDRLVTRLRQATGRSVSLGSVRLGVFGGVRLNDLEIGEPDPNEAPWLRADTIRINVSLGQLLLGQLEPTDVEADGLALRVHRRTDGTFEFGDLLQSAPEAPKLDQARPTDATPSDPSGALTFRVRDGRVSVVDEASENRIEVAAIEGRGTWKRSKVQIQELRGQINGGPFEMVAQFDRSGPEPMFDGQIRARQVPLGERLNALGYLLPIVSGMSDGVQGKLDLDLYLRGQGTSSDEVLRSLVGQGTIAIVPIRLDGSRVVAELSTLASLPIQGQVGSVRSDFAIRQGRIGSNDLTLTVSGLPIVLSGWTDFQGRLDYRVKSEGLTQRLAPEAAGALKDLPIDLNGLMSLRVQGTIDNLEVTVDGVPVGRDSSGRAALTTRRREFMYRLRDRILR